MLCRDCTECVRVGDDYGEGLYRCALTGASIEPYPVVSQDEDGAPEDLMRNEKRERPNNTMAWYFADGDRPNLACPLNLRGIPQPLIAGILRQVSRRGKLGQLYAHYDAETRASLHKAMTRYAQRGEVIRA